MKDHVSVMFRHTLTQVYLLTSVILADIALVCSHDGHSRRSS
jgi:hypothetical protein